MAKLTNIPTLKSNPVFQGNYEVIGFHGKDITYLYTEDITLELDSKSNGMVSIVHYHNEDTEFTFSEYEKMIVNVISRDKFIVNQYEFISEFESMSLQLGGANISKIDLKYKISNFKSKTLKTKELSAKSFYLTLSRDKTLEGLLEPDDEL